MADEEVVLVVASKVKDYVAKKGLRTSGDVPAKLTGYVAQLLDMACSRAQADGRQTLKDRDFIATVGEPKAAGDE